MALRPLVVVFSHIYGNGVLVKLLNQKICTYLLTI